MDPESRHLALIKPNPARTCPRSCTDKYPVDKDAQ